MPEPSDEKLRIREMTIDDFPEVFHIGEEVFTAEYSQSLYRTWDEYEITTLFNSDNELCLVAEAGEQILGFALGTTVRSTLPLEIRLSGLAGGAQGYPEGAGGRAGCSRRSSAG